MDQLSGQSRTVTRSTLLVMQMIREGHLSNAVTFMYCLHKYHLQEWVLVKRMLLSSANDHRSLLDVATVLDASKRNTLSESARIIPGLACFLHEPPCQELLD
jgi:hypothetical protein